MSWIGERGRSLLDNALYDGVRLLIVAIISPIAYAGWQYLRQQPLQWTVLVVFILMGALALGLAHMMISRGWYDRQFVREWTNAPHLVRSDTGRLLRAADLANEGDAGHFVAWDGLAGQPVDYDRRCKQPRTKPARAAACGRDRRPGGLV